MADKIVVLNHAASCEQSARRWSSYNRPDNLFVAGSSARRALNFLTGAAAARFQAHTVGVRPEHLTLSTGDGLWKGTVGVAEHLGSDTFLHVAVEGAGSFTVRAPGETRVSHGDVLYLSPDESRLHRIRRAGQGAAVSAPAADRVRRGDRITNDNKRALCRAPAPLETHPGNPSRTSPWPRRSRSPPCRTSPLACPFRLTREVGAVGPASCISASAIFTGPSGGLSGCAVQSRARPRFRHRRRRRHAL